jgi:hypothetical protein
MMPVPSIAMAKALLSALLVLTAWAQDPYTHNYDANR